MKVRRFLSSLRVSQAGFDMCAQGESHVVHAQVGAVVAPADVRKGEADQPCSASRAPGHDVPRRDNIRGTTGMKLFPAFAALALLALSSICSAQPAGVTPEMIASALPEEGAPKAVAGRVSGHC